MTTTSTARARAGNRSERRAHARRTVFLPHAWVERTHRASARRLPEHRESSGVAGCRLRALPRRRHPGVEGQKEDGAPSMGAALAFYSCSRSRRCSSSSSPSWARHRRDEAAHLLLTQVAAWSATAEPKLRSLSPRRHERGGFARSWAGPRCARRDHRFASSRRLDRMLEARPAKPASVVGLRGSRVLCSGGDAIVPAAGFARVAPPSRPWPPCSVASRCCSTQSSSRSRSRDDGLFAMIYKLLPSARSSGDVWVGSAGDALLFGIGSSRSGIPRRKLDRLGFRLGGPWSW